MSLQTRLAAFIQAVGADFKSLQSQIDALSGGSGGADPWTHQSLTTAYTNSTTTATNVFVGFVPEVGKNYIVDALLSVTAAAATTGVQTGLVGPTGNVSAVKIVSAASGTTDKIDHLGLNGFQVAAASLTTPTLISIQAILEISSNPTAQNVRVQARSEVAGSVVTIRPGSSMRWRTI